MRRYSTNSLAGIWIGLTVGNILYAWYKSQDWLRVILVSLILGVTFFVAWLIQSRSTAPNAHSQSAGSNQKTSADNV
jgi:ABC-type Fe3+-siderophore transport system permease subunit